MIIRGLLIRMEISMTIQERIFQALLFEAIALILLIPVASWATGSAVGTMAGVSVFLSLCAIVWNYFYNLGFDRLYGNNRDARGIGLRLLHTLGFEGGLILVTVPAIAWALETSLLNAFFIEAGILVFFFCYNPLFNWFYDSLRLKYVGPYQQGV
ncbi:Predicted membrane protein [Shewanella algae]|uniref:Predicted membrane protein n=2 Tax=Shewanella algae TaxID=38313 RepID=A0A379YKS4_9GAMM|nr:Predicted membrane protein [Shewanella algae]